MAKVLTKSDAKTKRIILPCQAVEKNLPDAVGASSFPITVTDAQQKKWEFMIRTWSNGANPKVWPW